MEIKKEIKTETTYDIVGLTELEFEAIRRTLNMTRNTSRKVIEKCFHVTEYSLDELVDAVYKICYEMW
jgi:hypothetical protein